MNMNKAYLKELFAAQTELERRISALKSIDAHSGCSECNQTSEDADNAEIRGLQQGEKTVDALINNYMQCHS